MSNDRRQRGGSRALILGFIGLVLVGLFQKLGLSFMRSFFSVLEGEVETSATSYKATLYARLHMYKRALRAHEDSFLPYVHFQLIGSNI